MFNQLKILFVSPEAAPFAKTGGLADVSQALPRAIRNLGLDIKVILPLYKCVKDGGFDLKKIASVVSRRSLGSIRPFDIYEYRGSGPPTYFINNEDFFYRDELYGTAGGDYPDNAYRFSFFSQSVLAALRAINFKCGLIHCNDWQTALVPFYLKFKLAEDNFYKGIKTLFSIHNLAYQGQFPGEVMEDIDIPLEFFNMNDLEFYGKVNFMKSGILYSNAVNTVSKGYAREILTPAYGCGLEGVLKTRQHRLFGITNGADYSEWDPCIDPHLVEKYSYKTVEKKISCKIDLLKNVNMKLSPDRPLLGVITRLARQKGIDLLVDILERLIELDLGIVLLGKGDEEYQNLFLKLSSEYPGHLSVNIRFDNRLAHKIEAGSDMFLMPSRYEPCGLNQMYSLRYGTIPIVRATGGLDDIIIDFDEDNRKGNGFKFGPATPDAFYNAIMRATRRFEDKATWMSLIKKVMQFDFSWEHSAKEYIELYERIIRNGGER